ncbi:DODA-type extradiol aromatic ring-opening family dioxygenase [Oceanibacterium hippocampi]|uniref:LigB family dioxygenase n=1 Tax=Oceanibacterium hippocampi TaxID=745714 RepID=A0A1Y5U0U5_9PROT|nr:class III extradiol ring-cleavage dioxygenase [Oceanibacterium hippocampi]SLN75769.1 LigB family dioxygenase [Oceanibacterium hippocampi]
MTVTRQPALYISHGGGPCFWIDFPPPFGPGAFDGLEAYLAGIVERLPARPEAFLVISAHWEGAMPTVGTAPAPGMLFDYYGFPKITYELDYPAPGAPAIAAEARRLLDEAGIRSAADGERGFDHGVFVPFLIIDPDAAIPVVTLSLRQDLDPAAHIAIGRALAPLRDQGVAIVGSGNSYHNLRLFHDGDGRQSRAFDDWLTATATAAPQARNAGLTEWERAPSARVCHPREEHLLPLMVVAGAAGDDIGRRSYGEPIGGKHISCFEFGF